MIKKADIILAAMLIIFGGMIAYMMASTDNRGHAALITVDGKEYGTYSLYENKSITVKQNGHINKIIIKDGMVSMAFSDCINQTCVHTGAISKTSQSIVCLPNKVMVQITGQGQGEAEYDAISN